MCTLFLRFASHIVLKKLRLGFHLDHNSSTFYARNKSCQLHYGKITSYLNIVQWYFVPIRRSFCMCGPSFPDNIPDKHNDRNCQQRQANNKSNDKCIIAFFIRHWPISYKYNVGKYNMGFLTKPSPVLSIKRRRKNDQHRF